MFSPTSFANFLACQHLTALDRAAEAKQIKRPFFADPLLDFLIKLGQAHEQAYLNKLTGGDDVNLELMHPARSGLRSPLLHILNSPAREVGISIKPGA
jgi:hypothetical protein